MRFKLKLLIQNKIGRYKHCELPWNDQIQLAKFE